MSKLIDPKRQLEDLAGEPRIHYAERVILLRGAARIAELEDELEKAHSELVEALELQDRLAHDSSAWRDAAIRSDT